MEPDLVLEVPDTPERLAQLANESSCSSSQKENFNAEVDPLSTSQNIRHLLLRNSCHPHPKDIGGRGVSIRSSTLNDTKLLSSEGKLAQLMSETLDKGRTPFGVGQSGVSTDRLEGTDWNHDMLTVPNGAICEDAKRKRGKGLLAERGKGLLDESSELPRSGGSSAFDEISELPRSSGSNALLGIGSSLPAISVGRLRSQIGTSISDKDNVVLQDDTHADMQFRNKGKEVDLSTGSHSESHQELASAIHTDVPHRPRGLRRLVRNGCISPYNIARTSTVSEVQCQNGMTSDGQKFSSFARISDQDKLKGIDILEDLQPKNNCRNLVRNGCISLNNSAEVLTVRHPIEDELEEMKFRGVPKPNGTSHKIHNVSPDSKDRGDNGKNGKGKAIADAFTLTIGQHGKANLPLGRPCREAGEGAIYGDRESHILGFEDLGWRRTHNWTEKESTASSSENVSIRGREEASGHRSDQCNEVATGTDLEGRRKKNTERKRKYGTGNSNGESSSSVFDVAEVSYLGTSWRPSKSRSTRTRNPRQRGIVLGAVIEVDELHSPEARSSNFQEQSHNVFDSCNARARQVESDELLAQQLQEQLYSESPVIRDRDEIDAAIAWSIQQEENARRASLASGQTRHSRRERLIARLHSQRSHRNYLSRSANNAQYRSSTRTTRLMRDVDFPQMDINMRFDLLEELEAGMNNANRIAFSNILHIQRDFNENDYETLLALDDNNHQHTGATENQINNLPQSVVQTVNVEEPCAVCLEKPSVGDIVRHLPCLHKFHKDCIDQWLRRKTSCPVCKNGIT